MTNVLRPVRSWTIPEVEKLLSMYYKGLDLKTIGQNLARSTHSVRGKLVSILHEELKTKKNVRFKMSPFGTDPFRIPPSLRRKGR